MQRLQLQPRTAWLDVELLVCDGVGCRGGVHDDRDLDCVSAGRVLGTGIVFRFPRGAARDWGWVACAVRCARAVTGGGLGRSGSGRGRPGTSGSAVDGLLYIVLATPREPASAAAPARGRGRAFPFERARGRGVALGVGVPGADPWTRFLLSLSHISPEPRAESGSRCTCSSL